MMKAEGPISSLLYRTEYQICLPFKGTLVDAKVGCNGELERLKCPFGSMIFPREGAKRISFGCRR